MIPQQMGPRCADPGAECWGRVAECNRKLFAALLAEARKRREAGDFGQTLGWCSAAAWLASTKGWFGELSSTQLESELLVAARSSPRPARRGRASSGRPRWLHVMTEAYATLGHTNLCRRWMQLDSETAHDVILLDQENGPPANLVTTLEAAQGRCVVLDPAVSVLQRAMELRNYAWENADVVVLHTHPDDVIATTAFGIEGGPPVLLVNHADHVFWVGCAVADLVLDIRPSGHLWTQQARGVGRAVILPIPLQDPAASLGQREKRCLREKLGLPTEGIMLLTVGSPAKYQPLPGLDFLEKAREILLQCPEAYVVAVGPQNEGVWNEARKAMGQRILPLGRQPDSTLFCQAADLYLEGLPVGSLTALLEAGLAGLPCVRGPKECIAPFTSDSESLDFLPQPNDIRDYVAKAVSLARNGDARREAGKGLQTAIGAQHCGEGWRQRLSEVKKRIPCEHSVYPNFNPKEVDSRLRDWFLRFLYAGQPLRSEAALASEALIEVWKRTPFKPLLDPATFAKLKEHDSLPRSKQERAGMKGKIQDALILWAWNLRINYLGGKGKLIVATSESLQRGRTLRALLNLWRCVVLFPSSLIEPAWLKLCLKAHLGPRLTGWLQRRTQTVRL